MTTKLTPRHIWLRNRVTEVVKALQELESIEDWAQYRDAAKEISKELHYASTEWEKYYED